MTDRAPGDSPETAPDPAPLLALSTAHWGAQTLLTANRLGLFALLADGPKGPPMDAAAVAAALGTDPRATRLLLNACIGLGLLETRDGSLVNSLLADAYLVPGRPGFLGNALAYNDDLYDAWGRLGETLANGRPAVAADSYTGTDGDRTRHFVRGMHNRALGIGRVLIGLVDLTGRRRLLDIGGGPGTYAALFAQAVPALEATVMDLPAVIEIGAEIVAEMGIADRVTHVAGNYRTAVFPGDQDAVLISGVFHRETEQTCRELIAKAREALLPGGLLIISDVFTDAGGTRPTFAALFGLNMLLTAKDGGVHADTDVATWLAEGGFGSLTRQPFPPPLPHRIVTGVRP